MEKYSNQAVLGLRVVQLLSVAFVIVGFIWSTSDLLLATILVKAPVTPLSVLFMLYGVVGAFSSEAAVRVVRRKKG